MKNIPQRKNDETDSRMQASDILDTTRILFLQSFSITVNYILVILIPTVSLNARWCSHKFSTWNSCGDSTWSVRMCVRVLKTGTRYKFFAVFVFAEICILTQECIPELMCWVAGTGLAFKRGATKLLIVWDLLITSKAINLAFLQSLNKSSLSDVPLASSKGET